MNSNPVRKLNRCILPTWHGIVKRLEHWASVRAKLGPVECDISLLGQTSRFTQAQVLYIGLVWYFQSKIEEFISNTVLGGYDRYEHKPKIWPTHENNANKWSTLVNKMKQTTHMDLKADSAVVQAQLSYKGIQLKPTRSLSWNRSLLQNIFHQQREGMANLHL